MVSFSLPLGKMIQMAQLPKNGGKVVEREKERERDHLSKYCHMCGLDTNSLLLGAVPQIGE